MSRVTGLKARPGFIERCAHTFTPAECPYEECGYRDALDEIERLNAELAEAPHSRSCKSEQEQRCADGCMACHYGLKTSTGHTIDKTQDFTCDCWKSRIDSARKESR